MNALLLASLLAAAPIEMIRLPEGKPSRSDSPISERSVVLAGIPVAVQGGLLDAREVPKLSRELGAAYAELEAERGAESPTPVLHTLAGLQSPKGFDVLVIPPTGEDHGDRAAIFLHGYGGNFALQCWMFAKAASRAGMLTVCPSLDVAAHWWEPAGVATLEKTMEWLHRVGRTQLVLAGLSNGGAGACILASEFESKFRGAIAISGTSSRGPRRLPMLVLHGADDEVASYPNARAFAAAHRERRFVELEGSHFAWLYERKRAAQLIGEFLQQRSR